MKRKKDKGEWENDWDRRKGQKGKGVGKFRWGNDWGQNSDWKQHNGRNNRPSNDWCAPSSWNNEGGQTSAQAGNQENQTTEKPPGGKRKKQ